jgi:hypothetical protein
MGGASALLELLTMTERSIEKANGGISVDMVIVVKCDARRGLVGEWRIRN